MPEAPLTQTRAFLPVEGMTCAACAGRVRRALLAVPGVAAAEVNPATGQAAVTGTAAPADLSVAVAKAGYRVPEVVFDLGIGGMTCASCVKRVERALSRVPGVLEVSVNLATERAHLRAVAGTEEAALAAAVAKAGYRLLHTEATESADPGADREKRDLIIAAILCAPFLAGMLGLVFGQDWMPGAWWQLALATPVTFGLGARFWRAGWSAARDGAGNMDQLVALGTGAAWALSTYLLLRHGAGHAHGLYFEAAAVVILFILLGKWLEARAKRDRCGDPRAARPRPPHGPAHRGRRRGRGAHRRPGRGRPRGRAPW